MLLGGCALFGGGERSAAVQPEDMRVSSPGGRSATTVAFRPAYGTGGPVALVPCGKGAKLTDECSGGNNRHQLNGDGPQDSDGSVLTEVSLAPASE